MPADRTSTGQVEHDDSQQVPCAQPHTTETVATFDPLVQTAATVQALNEAWTVVAIITLCTLIALPFASGREIKARKHVA